MFGTGGYMTSVDKSLYNGETTFIGRKGTINKPFFYNGEFWTVDTLFYTYAFKNIIPKFTYCLFQTINWLKYNEASGVPSLSKATIEKIKVSLPSIKEQEKISQLLFKLDERIATQNKIIEKLESLIKGLNNEFHNNVTGIITTFSEFGEAYSGLSGKNAESFGSGKPYITYLNVYQNDHIDDTKYDYVIIHNDEKQNKVTNGDVLFTLSSETPNEVGIGSVYLGNEDELYLNSFCFGIHIKNKELIYSPYMAYFVSCQYFRKAIYPLAQGSTRFNLQKSDFMEKRLVLPSFECQKHIANVLDSLSEKVGIQRQQLSLLQTQKQYLLQQMFI